MPIMRNWFHFAAIHRDNIRDVRIQFCEDAQQADHNALYQHKIPQPVDCHLYTSPSPRD